MRHGRNGMIITNKVRKTTMKPLEIAKILADTPPDNLITVSRSGIQALGAWYCVLHDAVAEVAKKREFIAAKTVLSLLEEGSGNEEIDVNNS